MRRFALALLLASALAGGANAQMANLSSDGVASLTYTDTNLHPFWGFEVSATQAGVMIVTPTNGTPSSPLATPAPICIPLEPPPSGGTQTYASWGSVGNTPIIGFSTTVTVSSGTDCKNITPAAAGSHITIWYQ